MRPVSAFVGIDRFVAYWVYMNLAILVYTGLVFLACMGRLVFQVYMGQVVLAYTGLEVFLACWAYTDLA